MLGGARGAWLGTFAANGLLLACNLATGILLARLLLPEGRGALAAIMFWPGLLFSLGMLSLHEATVHRVASLPEHSNAIAATAVRAGLVLATGTIVVAVALLPYLLGAQRESLWLWAQVYVLAAFPLSALKIVLLAVDQGELRFARYNLWRLSQAVVYLLCLIAIWATGHGGVPGAVAAFWLGISCTAMAQLLYRPMAIRTPLCRAELRPLLRIALRFHLPNLAFLVGTQLDRIAVTLFWSNEAIGLYVVALTVASTGLTAIAFSFQAVLLPLLSAEAEDVQRRILLASGLRYASLLLMAGTGGMMVVAPLLVPVVFGASFKPALPITYVLLAAFFPLGLRQVIIYSLRGFGEATPATVAELISMGAFLTCVWPLSHAWGLMGIGVALLLANTVSLGYLGWYLRSRFALRPAECWGLDMATLREALHLARTSLRLVRKRLGAAEPAAERSSLNERS